MLLTGHVIRITDRWTNPPQVKRHICIVPQRRLFLRINSQALWPPCHLLRAADNPGLLEWNSYVELRQLVRFFPDDVKRAVAHPGAILGRLSPSEANALAWAARRCPALSDENQQLVWENLLDLS